MSAIYFKVQKVDLMKKPFIFYANSILGSF